MRSQNSKFISTLLIAAACVSTQCLSLKAFARNLTEADLVRTVLDGKIFKTTSLRATFSDGTAIINMYRNPNAPERDLKIDAMLVAKCLRDKFPSEIRNVSMNFYDQTNRTPVRQCTVPEAMVSSFASGKMTQEDLLKYLTVTKGAAVVATSGRTGSYGGGTPHVSEQTVRDYKVAQGFNIRERNTLYLDICEVAINGVNVDAIWKEFMLLETAIRASHMNETIPQFNKVARMVQEAIPLVNQKRQTELINNNLSKSKAATDEAMAGFQPRWGFAYSRRCAIWNRLQSKKGQSDVAFYIQNFVEKVEPLSARGDSQEARTAIMSLERSLGLNYNQPF